MLRNHVRSSMVEMLRVLVAAAVHHLHASMGTFLMNYFTLMKTLSRTLLESFTSHPDVRFAVQSARLHRLPL